MTGRSPARLLAPVALVAAAVALFFIVSSPSSDEKTDPAATAPTATATATPKRERGTAEAKPSGETYTVQPGDTLDAIAAEAGVEVDDLVAVNPDVEATSLTVGEELQLP